MDTKIDPKVVTDVSIFETGGWNSFQSSIQKWLDTFTEQKEAWLLIGMSNRDPFFVTRYLERPIASSDQHIKKLVSLREGLHVMMQCYMRQYFAHRYWLHEHLGGTASWGEPMMRTLAKESTTC